MITLGLILLACLFLSIDEKEKKDERRHNELMKIKKRNSRRKRTRNYSRRGGTIFMQEIIEEGE